jgi:hypothetical protein
MSAQDAGSIGSIIPDLRDPPGARFSVLQFLSEILIFAEEDGEGHLLSPT